MSALEKLAALIATTDAPASLLTAIGEATDTYEAEHRNEVLDEVYAALRELREASYRAVIPGATGQQAMAFNRGMTLALNRVGDLKTEMS